MSLSTLRERNCKDCNVVLCADNSRREDGLLCRQCRSNRQCKATKAKPPEWHAERAEYMRQYSTDNADRLKSYQADKYTANRETIRSEERKRYASDPEYRKARLARAA